MPHLRALITSLALMLTLASTPAQAVTLRIDGTFASEATPGSASVFQNLAGGWFDGWITIPGTLPGASGTSRILPEFLIIGWSRLGQKQLAFSQGGGIGVQYFDFFGDGAADQLILAENNIQFQINLPRGFSRTSPLIGDAIFGVDGGPAGGVAVASGTATVIPLPPAALLLLAGIAAMGATRRLRTRPMLA